MNARAIIGTSGWRYSAWRGPFYPKGLVQRSELEYLADQLDSVEINGSFYSLQHATSYQRWHDETRDGFVFAVKGGRFITHMLRMRNVHTALANFYASGPLLLADKLGPFLWQLPEREAFDAAVLRDFFAELPTTVREATTLAADHNDKVSDVAPRSLSQPKCPSSASGTERSSASGNGDTVLRHALEVRHPTFVCDESLAIMREYNVALVIADTAGKWPATTQITADFVYVRLHGSEELYASGYTSAELRHWAQRVNSWRNGSGGADSLGRDVYVYFDNDAKAYAPGDAQRLAVLVNAHA